MVTLARRAARTPLAPVVGVMFGSVAAILVAALPGWMFESAVVQSGLPSILSFATPPLGLTARILCAALAFAAVAVLLWLVLHAIEAMLKRARVARAPWQDEGYAVAEIPGEVDGRRRPIFAPAELGAPLMSDEAILTPPLAVARISEPAFAPEPDLRVPLVAAEFDLPPPDSADDGDNSIQALIRRLESGLARRVAGDPDGNGPVAGSPSPLSLSSDWIVQRGDRGRMTYSDGSGNVRELLGTLRKLATR